MKLKGKVAIITFAFANEGVAVALAAHNLSRLEELAKDINRFVF